MTPSIEATVSDCTEITKGNLGLRVNKADGCLGGLKIIESELLPFFNFGE